jgi:hypothetical protein
MPLSVDYQNMLSTKVCGSQLSFPCGIDPESGQHAISSTTGSGNFEHCLLGKDIVSTQRLAGSMCVLCSAEERVFASEEALIASRTQGWPDGELREFRGGINLERTLVFHFVTFLDPHPCAIHLVLIHSFCP